MDEILYALRSATNRASTGSVISLYFTRSSNHFADVLVFFAVFGPNQPQTYFVCGPSMQCVFL